jgi:hypothetical protein
VKYWEIIADNLSKAGWSWGCVSAIDSNGRTFWIADAHRDDAKRSVVRADEQLTAFMELVFDLRHRRQVIMFNDGCFLRALSSALRRAAFQLQTGMAPPEIQNAPNGRTKQVSSAAR